MSDPRERWLRHPTGLVVPASVFEPIPSDSPSEERDPEWQLRFSPPMTEFAKHRPGFEFWWSKIQLAFDISDPRSFPPLPDPVGERDTAVLRRYIRKAEELAGTTVLNAHDAGMTVSFTPEGIEEVEVTAPPVDAIVGFATMFRQFYADEEEASFSAAQRILFQAAGAAGDDAGDERLEELRRWGRVVGKSKKQSVDRSAFEAMAAAGLTPPLVGTYPDQEEPEKVISTYFYGDHIHWSSKKGHADVVAEREASPFDDASYRHEFLKATMGLAHVYIGYGVLARAAARRSLG